MVVLPHVSRLDTETDCEVRLKVIELIVDLAETCTSDHFFRLHDVIKKVTYLHFENLISVELLS